MITRSDAGFPASACRSTDTGPRIGGHIYGDWHALIVMQGSLTIGARAIGRNEVVIVEPAAGIDEIIAGRRGVELSEAARATAGMDRVFGESRLAQGA